MGGGANSQAMWGSALGSLANAGTTMLMFKMMNPSGSSAASSAASPDNPIPTAGTTPLGPSPAPQTQLPNNVAGPPVAPQADSTRPSPFADVATVRQRQARRTKTNSGKPFLAEWGWGRTDTITPESLSESILRRPSEFAGNSNEVMRAFHRYDFDIDERRATSLAQEAQDLLDVQEAQRKRAAAAQSRSPNRGSTFSSQRLSTSQTVPFRKSTFTERR